MMRQNWNAPSYGGFCGIDGPMPKRPRRCGSRLRAIAVAAAATAITTTTVFAIDLTSVREQRRVEQDAEGSERLIAPLGTEADQNHVSGTELHVERRRFAVQMILA